jgi:hypothetical protein
MAALVPIERGQHDEAVALTARAAAGTRQRLGEQHRWSANAALAHGVALLGAGRLDASRVELQRALAIRQAVLPAGHGDFFAVHLALGRLALAQQRLPAAEAELRRALQVANAQPGPGRSRTDLATLELGRVLALQGRAEAARVLAERAATLAAQRYPPGDWRLRAMQAQVLLPPFTAQLGAADRAEVQLTLTLLRQRLAPQAPLVQDIERALQAAR